MDELAYKPNWPEAKARLEAWWQGEPVDRPLIQITARKKKGKRPKPATPDKPVDLVRRWTDPDIIIPQAIAGMEGTWYGGEAVPHYWPNFGPGCLASFLGCEPHMDDHTVWVEPMIDDWDHVPDIRLDPENRWWKAVRTLTERACEVGKGKFLVGMTDIGGAADTLSYLRTPENLCMDVVEHPDRVHEMEELLNDFWFEVYEELYGIFTRHQQGSSAWLGVWHPGRTYIPQCDFSCMISSAMFDEFFIPILRKQMAFLDMSIYHLDGPGAIRHLDSILKLPHLRAIQWIQGAGGGAMIEWLDLMKRIQSAGMGLHLWVKGDEVLPLIEALSPKGLMFICGADSPEHGEFLLRRAREITAGKKM